MKFIRELLALLSGHDPLRAELDSARRAGAIHGDLARDMSAKASRLESELRFERETLAALRAERGLPPPAISEWSRDELAKLREFLRTPVGAKYAAQLRDMAARQWAASAACPVGQEARRIGYCHGFTEASATILHLCALLDREPAEPSDADAPSGGDAASQS